MKKPTTLYLVLISTIASLHVWVTASELSYTTTTNNHITEESIFPIWNCLFNQELFTLHMELDTNYDQEAFLSGKIYLKNPKNFLAGTVEIKFSNKNKSAELQWLRIHQDMRSKKIGSLCIEALKKTCLNLGYEIITLDAKFIDHSDTEDTLIDDQKAHALSYCKTLQFYARHNAVLMPSYLQKELESQHILNANIRNCCIPLCIPLTHTAYTLIKKALKTDFSKKWHKKPKSLLFPPKKAEFPPSEMLVVQHTVKKLFPRTLA